jgi:phosphoribosyl 1,2-cyclic phosphodiesterase
MLKIIPLASGSGGNCTWIETESDAYLVDCGIRYKTLLKRVENKNLNTGKLRGIMITHEHIDHVVGIKLTSTKLNLPVYCNVDTATVLKHKNLIGPKLVIFKNNESFVLNNIRFLALSIPHDSVDAVAYTLEYADEKVAVATDFGYATASVKYHLSGCTSLLLESNYDETLLKTSGRRWTLIQRIMSKHGHLSNEQSMSLISELIHDDLKELWIGHISEQTNNYDLVKKIFQETLINSVREDIELMILKADGSCSARV